MPPLKFSTRLLLTLLFALALTSSCASWLATRFVRERLQTAQEEQLRSACRRIAERLPDPLPPPPLPNLQKKVAELAAETGFRLTVVDVDGHVVADALGSDEPGDRAAISPRPLSYEPDLVMAASSGQGLMRDAAHGAQSAVVRLALRVPYDGKPRAYVRGIATDEAIAMTIDGMKVRIWGAMLFATACTIPLVWRIANQTTRPLDQLRVAADHTAEGDYTWRFSAPAGPEVRSAIQAFDRMADAVRLREAELRENLARRSAVLSGMLEGVIAVDRQEQILFANAAAGKLLGFSLHENEQRTLLEAVRLHPLRAAVRDVLRDRQPCRRELQLHGPPQRELEIHAMPLPGSSSPGVILVVDDVTHLRRLEGVRQQFIANVSHELKTPLSSIKAYAETLLGGAIDDAPHNVRFLERIVEQTDRLHQLILDMLSLSKIETGQAPLDICDVEFQSLAVQSLAEHAQRAAGAGVELQLDMVPPEIRLRADEEGLRQILDNLIDNAVKYTTPGGTVTLRARCENRTALIQVVDTGAGIASEHLDRIFERFYRVDHARSRELGGTGLGLSIVKHLAQAMGGSVKVESQLGKGSVFSVRLPSP